MALPQNPQGVTNTDRILLEAVNAQTQNLQGQTKVLHTVSDRLMKQNKEFQSLRKDMQEMGKTLLQGQGSNLSEIKKYFEKNKSNFRERPKVGSNSDKNSEDKGFFKNIIGKLFGPSKYQQKMMDDTSQILSLTEVFTSDIGFIREKYSDSARAKERELLASAIAERINNIGGGGGEGGGLVKGLLGGFGSLLVTGIGAVLAAGFSILSTAINEVTKLIGTTIHAVLKGIIEVLERLAAAWGASKILDPSRRPGGPNAPNAPGAPSSGGIPPVVVNKETTTGGPGDQKRLPGGKLPPLLSGPGQAGMDPEKLVRNSKGIYVPESQVKGGIGGGLAKLGVLAALGAAAYAAYNYFAGIELKEDISQTVENNFPDAPLAKWLAPNSEEYNSKLKRNSLAATQKTADDIKARKEKNRLIASGLLSESGDEMVRGKDGKYYPNQDIADSADKLSENQETMMAAMKAGADKLSSWGEAAGEISSKAINKAISFVDTAFQLPITVDGQTQMLDLAPGLGTATAKVLKDIAAETADLVGAGMDKAGDVITQINNNNNQTASAPMPFSAATPKSVHEATMDLYKIYYGKIR
jgi:hypothetical protein